MSDVGADIESVCSKCGDVWHVVVAKVEEKIVKVQCKECKAEHRYKAPKSAKAAKAKAKKKPATKRKTTKKKAEPEPVGPTVEPDLSKPSRPYSIRDSYKVAERIDHPKFGTGIVEVSSEPGKMTVFFPDGRRVLAQAKIETGLARPAKSFDRGGERR
jgi:DNA-directed RNA polymerase subunit M/transcription elongation factor TFIIS